MDWLSRLFGGVTKGVSNFVGGITRGPNQVVNNAVKRAAPVIRREATEAKVNINNLLNKAKVPRLKAPEMPKININDLLNKIGEGAKTTADVAFRGANSDYAKNTAKVNVAKMQQQKNPLAGLADKVTRLTQQVENVRQAPTLLARDTAVNVARAVPQAPIRLALSQNAYKDGRKEYTPTSGVEKMLLGTDKVKGVGQYGRDMIPVAGEKMPAELATALGLAMVVGDLVPTSSGGKKGIGTVVKELSKIDDARAVGTILKGIGITSDPKLAKTISKTTDPKVIGKMINDTFRAQQSGKKVASFTRTVQQSPNTTQKLALKIGDNTAMPTKTNKKLIKDAQKIISEDLNKAKDIAMNEMSDRGTAIADNLIIKYQKMGDWESAVDVADAAARNLNAAGRQVQAAAIFNKLDPQAVVRATQARINKVGGKKLAPDMAQKLTEMAQSVQKMAPGPDRDFAQAQLLKEISNAVPSGFLEKATTLRKAGLLTGLKTMIGAPIANAANLTLNTASNLAAAPFDLAQKLVTGKRGTSFTIRGLGKGAREGAEQGLQTMKTGIDPAQLADMAKYDLGGSITYKNKAVQKYVDTVFNIMASVDKPARRAAYQNELYNRAITAAKNAKIGVGAREDFIRKFLKDPPLDEVKKAMDYSEKAVFANDTALSNVISGAKNALKGKSPVAAAAVDVVAPFTKVPSSVVRQAFDYTPVGPAAELYGMLKKGGKGYDQGAVSRALGKASVGTGAMVLGAKLALEDKLTGSYPETEQERLLWQQQGKIPNAIKIGDRWYSMNYLAPGGTILQTGAGIIGALKEGKSPGRALMSGAAGLAKSTVDQSFLQGVQGALDAINDPDRSLPRFVNNMAGSVIPTLVADIARGTDEYSRKVETAGEAVMNRIPGLSQNLNAKQDAFGAPVQREGGFIKNLLDPFRSSKSKNDNDPLTQELLRLNETGNGIMPSIKQDTLEVGDQKVKLNSKQLFDKNAGVGPEIKAVWSDIIASPEYQAMDNAQKRAALEKAKEDINAVGKVRTLADIDQSLATKAAEKLTGRQADAFANGKTQSIDYLIESAKDATPKRQYEIDKAKYDADKKAGRISEVKDVKRLEELRRSKAKSGFERDVVDLYSFSVDDVYDFVGNNDNGKALFEQVLALDAALVAEGFKSKWYDKYGNLKQPKGEGGSGSGSGRKRTQKTPYIGGVSVPSLDALTKLTMSTNAQAPRLTMSTPQVQGRSNKGRRVKLKV